MNRIAFFLPALALVAAFVSGYAVNHWIICTLIAAAAEGILYLMFFLNNSSTEYLSGHITAIIHHFPWTERKETTKTESGGRKTTTVTYIDHGHEYFAELNTENIIDINESLFDNLSHKWNTNMEEIHVSHRHCVDGGGGEQKPWDGNELNNDYLTLTHRYRNPVKNSISAMRGAKVKKDEALALGLFEYPKVEKDHQQAILKSPDANYTGGLMNAEQELQRLNAFCGKANQIHVFILLFPSNDGANIAAKQCNYWKGCNKNELVVCLGVDGTSIDWCEPLSWMDDPTLHNAIKDYFRQNSKSSLTDFVKWLRDNLNLWKRKEVKELKNSFQMSLGSTLFLWISACAIAILVFLCAYWIG